MHIVGEAARIAHDAIQHLFIVAEGTVRCSKVDEDFAAALGAVRA